MTASASQRGPSAIDALGEAISHTRAKLFPFRFVGWLTLGFITLIETYGSGSAGGGLKNKSPNGAFGDPVNLVEDVSSWISSHMLFFVGVLMIVMLISMIVVWIRSRMVFVYIDNVASGRFDLIRPWSEHGERADSFFALSLVVQGAAMILLLLILGSGVLFGVWARARDWGFSAIALGAIPILFIFVLSVVAAALLDLSLRDFVAPLQISRDIGAKDAGGVFLSMLSANPGLLIGYALLKFIAWIVAGFVVLIGGCLTCCIGFIPLINQTLFQPIYYVDRAWSLKLLAQMGDDVFARFAPVRLPAPYESPSDALTGPIDLSQFDFENPPPEDDKP